MRLQRYSTSDCYCHCDRVLIGAPSTPLKIRPCHIMVPMGRLELPRLSPLPPQDSVSTNFTTSASIHTAERNRSAPCNYYFGISFVFESASAGTAAGAAGVGTSCPTGGLPTTTPWDAGLLVDR